MDSRREEYDIGANDQYLGSDQIIHFRYPESRDLYNSGLSLLRAALYDLILISH